MHRDAQLLLRGLLPTYIYVVSHLWDYKMFDPLGIFEILWQLLWFLTTGTILHPATSSSAVDSGSEMSNNSSGQSRRGQRLGSLGQLGRGPGAPPGLCWFIEAMNPIVQSLRNHKLWSCVHQLSIT